ncbi:MAG: FAD-dependent oxidoreductase [Gammaproteobacteria bacterium]|nr:FAD-dependent oxidoreductase [Gammaproteobacteria bacterium]
MNSRADVIVIGAGIIGLCSAFQIRKRSSLSVLIFEQGASLGEGSTGASAAVCRHRYSYDEMVELARDGIHAYRQWPRFIGTDQPLAQFQNDGVLWLSDGGDSWANRESKRLEEAGIRTNIVDAADIKSRFPALNPCSLQPDTESGEAHDCNAGTSYLFEVDGGYFDPVSALQDLHSALLRKKVEVQFRSRVQKVLVKGGRTKGIQLNDGSVIEAPCVINATGPWCNEVFDQLGLNLPWSLKPTRIQIIHIDRPTEVIGDIPVCCDIVGGIYFRQHNRGQQIVLGSTLEEDELEVVENPSDFNGSIDDAFKVAKLHALHHRIPSLPYRGSVKGYCGLYTVNRDDVHPIVGESPIAGFYVANGFSGHGFKLAPAVGAMLAKEITGESSDFDTSVPSSFLAFDRNPLELDVKNVLA